MTFLALFPECMRLCRQHSKNQLAYLSFLRFLAPKYLLVACRISFPLSFHLISLFLPPVRLILPCLDTLVAPELTTTLHSDKRPDYDNQL